MKELHIIGGGPAGLAIGYHAKKIKSQSRFMRDQIL